MGTSPKNSTRFSRRSMLASVGIGGLGLAIDPAGAIADSYASQRASTSHSVADDWNDLHYGKWSRDDAGLPCFDVDLERHPAPYYCFSHLISTGTIGTLVDQWGNVKLISTEDGLISLTPTSEKTFSGMYAMLESQGQLYSLVYSELQEGKGIRYGVSYVEYSGALKINQARLAVRQEVYTPPDEQRYLRGQFTFYNSGEHAITGTLRLHTDVFIRPGTSYKNWVKSLRPDCGSGSAVFREANAALGDVFLIGGSHWAGSSRAHSLTLSKDVTLAPGESLTVPVMLGYSKSANVSNLQAKLSECGPADSRRVWSKRLSSFAISGLEPWVEDECRWTLGQLFAFENYDRILDQHYLHLGGYDFIPNPDNPASHLPYTVREAAGNALAISHFDPELAKSSLRWLAQMQLTSGDIPKNYDYTKERLNIEGDQRDSDTEIWFLMALCEYVEVSGDMDCLEASLRWFPDGETTLWDHAKRAFTWITQGIGVGQHGLILILEGDWNDYLSMVGAGGKGESVMNSGMAAKAFDSLARIAHRRGDHSFAAQAETWRDSLCKAVANAFDREWFVGCYDDRGRPIAGYADRVYLNAQTWAALGKCGTAEQRRKALMSAVRECGSDLGLMLMSKAYSSPAPPEISWCAIPRGQGENGGIWPQTIFWAVWAMAEEGLLDAAASEWKKGTLRHHSRNFPQVPYGIYNAPDCWSSRLASHFEGWTQHDLFNRATYCPMSPMIAWQAFAMQKIDECRRRHSQEIQNSKME